MRRSGPLLVVILVCILGGVGASYYARLKLQNSGAAPKPKALPRGTAASAQDWTYTQTKDQKPVVSVRAKDMEEVGGKYELSGVELRIFHREGDQYDQVKSAKAEFDIQRGELYSEGEVEITMGVKPGEAPSGRLLSIKSSGVHVESKTGKASTDRPATFGFDRGQGQAVGAAYDPTTRELHMHSQVRLLWRGSDPKAQPMHVESGELTYKEKDSKVFLAPWSKLMRATLTLNAGPAEVTLNGGAIQLVEAVKAQGTDARPGRNLDYSADRLTMNFDGSGEIRSITGAGNARLVSTAETAVTKIASDRVDLDFDTAAKESVLRTALSTGHAIVESAPMAKPGADTPETRILKSESITTKMRAGGQEIEMVETGAPGSIEFAPNRPGQPHRFMNGERIWIAYGPKNQIHTFRAVNVSTRTESAKSKDPRQPAAPALTWSKDLLATFEANSSQMEKLEQWNDFRYQEGDRKAKAERATLEQAKNLITLTNGARVWDATGSADGDKIVLDQKSGDFTAEGNVNSTRMPDKKPDRKPGPKEGAAGGEKSGGANSAAKDSSAKDGAARDSGAGGLLAEDEPLHAKARKMLSTGNNLQIRYEGNALLWQGANRLQADVVEIDREEGMVKAHGHVVSQLLDKPKDNSKDISKDKPDSREAKKAATKAAAPVFTIVKAPELVYKDEDRLADYTGGVVLNRPNMQVTAREIRAFLRDSGDNSSLDHAFADGQVEIAQSAAGRKRNGSSEHAEYYVDDDKVILEGGDPQFADSVRGRTRGRKLTWFSKDDRLLVNGAESQPAHSVLPRK